MQMTKPVSKQAQPILAVENTVLIRPLADGHARSQRRWRRRPAAAAGWRPPPSAAPVAAPAPATSSASAASARSLGLADVLDLGVGGALVGHQPAEPAGRLRAPPEDRQWHLRGCLQGRHCRQSTLRCYFWSHVHMDSLLRANCKQRADRLSRSYFGSLA